MRMGNSASGVRDRPGRIAFQAAALVSLFAIGAVLESLRLTSLHDSEIWRHLRVGNWILANGSWPRAGLFSQVSNREWRDFSWGYDLLSASAYSVLGLLALPLLRMGFEVMLAVSTFILAGGRRHFWNALAFSAVAQYLMGSMGPGAAWCSVALFGIELVLLQEIRSTGNVRLMYALPAMFLLWANLDVGFVFGLVTYVLFLLAFLIEAHGQHANWQWTQKPSEKLSIGTATIVGLGSVMASLINPYGIYTYPEFFSNQADAISVNLPGHAAMGFHRPQDYVLLLLTMTAFLVLGLRRSLRIFPLCLLTGCTVLAFRSESNGWLAALACLTVIGERTPDDEREKASVPLTFHWDWKALGAATALSLVIAGLVLSASVPRRAEGLVARISDRFPVQACNFIRQHDLPQPIFNSLAWGGFLIWYLPEYPVAIDGRRGLYSEQEESDYSTVMKGEMPFKEFAPIAKAQTLLLEKGNVMGEVLRDLPGFQVAYEDSLAIVFLRHRKE